jgi:hypothetical protein
MPDALEVAAMAAFNLAGNLETGEESDVWREAIELGKASGTKDGKHVAERALHYLTLALDNANDGVAEETDKTNQEP